jgi:urease accessory protein
MEKIPLRLSRGALVLLFLLIFPASAQAHSDLRMGAFAGGLLHPLEVPSHLLILLSLGLRLGQHPPFRLRWFLAIFAPVAAIALLTTVMEDVISVPQPFLMCIALCVGALVSSAIKTPAWINHALLVVAALAIGLDSGVKGASAIVVAKVLFANWVCLLVIIGYIAFYVSLLPPLKWLQIGVRILGSWIVAICFLLLALYLKKP